MLECRGDGRRAARRQAQLEAARADADSPAQPGARISSLVQQELLEPARFFHRLDGQDGPVILVGNSYGGSIITVAGSDPKVKALVYVAALQPDVGETSAQVAPPKNQGSNDLRPTKDGFIFLDPAKYAADVGADLPKATADFMARSQMPIFGAAFGTKLTAAAWRDKPSYAIVATEDRELDPAIAQRMANRAGSKVTNLKGSHLIFISQPRAVARVIETAARAVK